MPRPLLLLMLSLLLLPQTLLFAQPGDQAVKTENVILPAFDEKQSPEELLKAVETLWETPIEAQDAVSEKEQKLALLNHIITGCELLLKNEKTNEEIALTAVQNKMQALGILARAGDAGAPFRALAMAEELTKDKRPLVAREGKLILLSGQLREIPEMEPADQEKFVNTLLEILSVSEISERELQITNFTATLLERAGQANEAQRLLGKAAELMKKSEDPEIRAYAANFEGLSRRLGLPGNPLKLSGETLEGEKFDIKDLKGKVVLVQYWASWCTYCLQEMPHIQQVHHKYQTAGFEVVGVNLDEAANRAKEIVNDQKLPWIQLFSNDPEALGMENPNAVYYGINSIPQCILLDREGNVITLNARGKILDEQLEKLFPEKP